MSIEGGTSDEGKWVSDTVFLNIFDVNASINLILLAMRKIDTEGVYTVLGKTRSEIYYQR